MYLVTFLLAHLQTKGREGVVAFTSSHPVNKVQRVSGQSALSGGAQRAQTTEYDESDLVDLALDVTKINARLDRGK